MTRVCSHCLEPIEAGQERIFRVNSNRYHKECVNALLNGFREEFKKAKGRDLPRIMTDMERVFDIPSILEI